MKLPSRILLLAALAAYACLAQDLSTKLDQLLAGYQKNRAFIEDVVRQIERLRGHLLVKEDHRILVSRIWIVWVKRDGRAQLSKTRLSGKGFAGEAYKLQMWT